MKKNNNSSKTNCNRTNKVSNSNKTNKNNSQMNKEVRKNETSKSFEIDPNDEHSFNLR